MIKLIRDMQDKQRKLFEKGGPLERLYPLYEANDTFLFTPDSVTEHDAHVRDGADLKRVMITVVVALVPCMLMAMYNTGLQANLALSPDRLAELVGIRYSILRGLGIGFSPESILACLVHGALYYVPVYIVTLAAGGLCEAAFAIVRKHEINEGFLVTSALFPLILPPTIPLWQVALGIIFGVVIGKEIFGGVGMNIFNPALMARAFLFFAYPGQISGDKVWTAVPADAAMHVDGFSGATWLARAAESGMDAIQGLNWWDAFLGFIPGSMGETSTLACLFGAAVLIITKVGSWRTMAGGLLGSFFICALLNFVGRFEGTTNVFLDVPFYWHWVLGGFAFAIVFMATDPVSSAFTETGKWVYGFFIGVLGILIRVINPAYPEGWMLAILFMNMFAPVIDHFVVKANIKRRMARYAA
ncbi:MAG: Na(+)-translocating NADH-quinone reductase subunit B [Candidatus Hydrogenedentota bacterium]